MQGFLDLLRLAGAGELPHKWFAGIDVSEQFLEVKFSGERYAVVASRPVDVVDVAAEQEGGHLGEPLVVVERASAVLQGGTLRVLVKGDAVAEIKPTCLYTAKPDKLDPGFVYSVGRRELLAVTQSPDLLRGRRIVLRRTVADGGTQEAPVACSMVGSSTRLGASWTITTAPGVDVLAVLSIFLTLTCMGMAI